MVRAYWSCVMGVVAIQNARVRVTSCAGSSPSRHPPPWATTRWDDVQPMVKVPAGISCMGSVVGAAARVAEGAGSGAGRRGVSSIQRKRPTGR